MDSNANYNINHSSGSDKANAREEDYGNVDDGLIIMMRMLGTMGSVGCRLPDPPDLLLHWLAAWSENAGCRLPDPRTCWFTGLLHGHQAWAAASQPPGLVGYDLNSTRALHWLQRNRHCKPPGYPHSRMQGSGCNEEEDALHELLDWAPRFVNRMDAAGELPLQQTVPKQIVMT